MKIRPAEIKDLDSLMDITRRCIQTLDKKGIFQWDEVYPSIKDFHGDITGCNLYVTTPDSGDNISGCICINDIEYPGYENARWKGSSFFIVHKMMIDPLYEGQGYGKFAMNFAEELSGSFQKDSIRLDCFQKNVRANRFYQGLGYIKKGETPFRTGMFNLYEKVI